MPEDRRGLPTVVEQWLHAHGIAKEDLLIVAMSAGRDSMALGEALNRIGQNILAAHVNYGLRGIDSDGDQACVEAWSKRHQVPLEVHKTILQGDSEGTQSEARRVRYVWMEQLRQKQGPVSYIATGHHADDQAETLLLHLIRSADPLALSAMSDVSREGTLLRPFLGISREEINAWVKSIGLEYRDDTNNTNPAYLRNRLRHEVLPLLESLRAGSGQHLARLAERWRPLSNELHQNLDAARNRCFRFKDSGSGVLELDAWKQEPLADEILYRLAKDWKISARAVPEIRALAQSDIRSGARFETAHVHIFRERNSLIWNQTPS